MPETFDLLIPVVRDSEGRVRQWSIQALGKIRQNEKARLALQGIITNPYASADKTQAKIALDPDYLKNGASSLSIKR